MRKICLLTLMILSVAISDIAAQEHAAPSLPATQQNLPFIPKAYLGLSSGLNGANGILGFSFEVPVTHAVSIGAGVGVSTWGTKVFGEARYYLKPTQCGWALGAGITHNTGVTDVKHKHSTIRGDENVTLDLDPQTNVFIAAYRFWHIGKGHNRFYLTAGYSVPLEHPSYHEVSGDPLTGSADEHVKKFAPGGLIAGLGFSFGIR
jgi:hypothetical protein